MRPKLPDFLVIGGMRCGSTTLHNVLSAHPQLFLPKQKELHFFDGYNEKLGNDIAAYKKLFESVSSHQICGEVTPDYLTTPGAFEQISNTFKELKVIVILREPVARMCSHYLMSCAMGFEVLPFAHAVESEKERLSDRDKIADIFHSYSERSTYLPQLKNCAERFGKENVHVIFLEELNKKPSKVLAKLWFFLGVDLLPEESISKLVMPSNQNQDIFRLKKNAIYRVLVSCLNKLGIKNKSILSQPAISSQNKQVLSNKFEAHNKQLSEWLGRELPW